MARSRNIKPGFFSNEELVELPFSTRLLFIGLWTLADRMGRMEDRPKRIKMDLFPADNLDIDAALTELQTSGFLLRYEVDGKRYIQVLAFDKHQNPHRDEKASTIPAPCEHSASTVQEPEQHTSNPADSLIPDSLIPDSLIPDSGFLVEEQAPPAASTASRKRKAAPATRLPADWLPTDGDAEFCKAERPDLQITAVADRFRDYWHAMAGVKGQKVDWNATWRNWVRNERRGVAQGPPPGYQTANEKQKSWADRITGKTRNELNLNIIDATEHS